MYQKNKIFGKKHGHLGLLDSSMYPQGNTLNENVQQRFDLGKEKRVENIKFAASLH